MKKQSKQSKVSIRRFLCVSILIVGISIFSSMRINATTVSYDPSSYSSLTLHDPIYINSDSGLEVFLGTGTVEDPYVIDSYNITTTSNYGIHITDTTKFFIIRNCYVDADYDGIHINDVADGTATVINNTCNNNWNGIVLWHSGSSTVANNTCSNNNKGIYIFDSSSSTVANNTCNNNYWNGICIYESGSSTVANNTFSNCGLYISESTVDAYLSYTVENNWVNGKKLGFYTNLDSTTIAEPVYGQLILVNCTNVTVRDQILNDTSLGLFLYSCTSSVIINNTCNNNKQGILLSSSGSSTVANNTCSNNVDGSIHLHDSGSSTVANNTCSNNHQSILLSSSGSSTVSNNTCSNNNDWGILLDSSASCVFTYNLLQENKEHGIFLRSGSDNNLIHHNTFVDNNLGGTSQAFDEGANNLWYDYTIQEGNYWSDWSGIGSYSIDGSVYYVIDPYPLDEPVVDVNPPLIVDIIHSPSTPTELDTVTINATVIDASGVQFVTLYYKINDESWQIISMTLVSGDIYSVTIGSFVVGDTIEYYVSAIDNSTNHNEAINDNAGLYYSFTVSVFMPEFQMLSLLLPTLTFLFIGFGLVVLQRRKK